MRRIIIYILMIIGVFQISSCNGIVDIDQNTQIATATAWGSEASAQSNVSGMYYLMRTAFSSGFAYWGEYRNGLWEGGRRNGDHEPLSSVMRNTLNSTNTMSNWANLYTTINQANLAITHLPDVHFADEQTKAEALASAYFVRAFCYYWIARIWGDAPLELVPYESLSNNQFLPRTSVSDIFVQVESDILRARELIAPTAISKIQVSYAAVEMLTADYFLWKYKKLQGSDADLNMANQAVQNVLNNPSYGLEAVFADIFEKEATTKEVIFKWPYTQAEYENGYPYDYLYATTNIADVTLRNTVIPVSPDPQWVNITPAYAAFLYEDADIMPDSRAAVSYGVYETFGWVNKFPGHLIAGERVYDTDINVYRYADAILFDAEIKLAQHDVAGAKIALNKIATRAYNLPTKYDGLTLEQDVLNAIVAERKKEFVGEGRTWWDFIRLGVVFTECPSLVGRENEKNILLWPVHTNSINSNPNVKQTEGY